MKGLIKDEEIEADGLSLKWGDKDAVVGWTKKMIKGRISDKLAEGPIDSRIIRCSRIFYDS